MILFYSFFVDINESVVESAALSLVDGQLWDLHRPITVAGDGEDHECTIEFLRFTDKDPYQVRRKFALVGVKAM